MRGNELLLASALAAAVGACVGANSGPPATPIDVGQAASVGPVLTTTAPSRTCVVRDRDTKLDLKVHAADETIDLRITGMTTESELEKDGSALVHVRGAVQFDGRVALADSSESPNAALRTTREVVALGGLVKLGKGVEIVRARRTDDAATGIALVGGFAVDDVPVPCDALAIEFRSTTGAVSVIGDDDEERSWVGPHGDQLTVCASPSLAPPCVTTHELAFEEVSRRSGVVEVRARFDDESAIQGWVKAEHVTSTDAPVSGGFGSIGGCSCGRAGFLPHLTIGKPNPREHHGKAKLEAGSAIYAQPDFRGRWATATAEVIVEITMSATEEFARITDLPGVSTTVGCDCPGMDDHAYVKREAVIPIR